jgi:tRNA threonylcarbamoyladenosine biosynthesis protein TsaB
MSLILCIDTALQIGSVSLSKNGRCIAVKYSNQQQEHASFLQPAIKMMLEEAGLAFSSLDAVAVSNGPGSYTGLRVGLASAKGLCFALNIPLLTISTLEVMAMAMKTQLADKKMPYLLCPMIDARRMEVFTALYNHEMTEILPAAAVVLEPAFLAEYAAKSVIVFAGNGANKWMTLAAMDNALLIENMETSASFATLAAQYYHENKMANLAYAEPFYCKAFYQPPALK